MSIESTKSTHDMEKIREMLLSGDTKQKNKAYRMLCMEKFENNKELFTERVEPAIEKYRKGDCTMKLTDQNGTPLSGKRIRIQQKTHDFKYGANIFLLDEFKTEEENKIFRDTFHQYFNLATVPFYWAELEPEQGKLRFAADSPKIYRRPAPDLCVDYCNEYGVLPKLHCLFYDKFIPSWLPKRDEKAMKELYEKRFSQIAERYSGKMYEFEVTNELLDEGNWGDACSVLCEKRDTPLWAYQLARKYFPGDTLVINESNRVPEIAEQDYRSPYFMFIEGLLLKGAFIDKIGIQNHIFCGARGPQETEIFKVLQYFNPVKVLDGLGYLAEFGKPLEITEVTIPTFGEDEEAEELQADILRHLYRLWFSIPGMESVVYWNTVDGMAYVEPNGISSENRVRGGLFHRDLTPKKAALELKELFEKEWHTDLELVTDENGKVDFRGFYGDYILQAEGVNYSFGIHKDGAIENIIELER